MQDKIAILRKPKRFIEEILGYQVAPHHAKIFRHIRTNDRTLDLAPRGFGKSTVGNVAYVIWRIVQDRNLRILIVSNTQRQAEAFVREVKTHLENNQKLIELYGSFVTKNKWTESELLVSGRTDIKKEVTLTAFGGSGAVISKHFSCIICDDIVDFENARTELQRQKLKEWYYSSLSPTLEPDGELHIIGTCYHPSDLYQDLIASNEYDVQIQRAINLDGTSLWPDKFTIEELNRKKEESGSLIFNMQYLNDVTIAKQGHIFQYKWFNWWDILPVAHLKIFMGVDLAISASEQADYFVICTIGIDAENKIYVLDVFRARLSFKEQMTMIQKKAEEWKPIKIGIESNAYQKAMAQELIRTTQLPIRDLMTTKDKVSRAQRRSAEFENGRVYLKKDMHLFADELVLFPDAQHDDMIDAFDFARQVSEVITAPPIPVFGRSFGASGVSI